MKVALPLAKNVLAPLGLTAAMSAIDGSIQKKIHGSGLKLIIEQEDMNDIMKIIKALGVHSRNNLPNKIKKGAYVINLDEYENTGTHWVSLFVKTNESIYFDSFGVEHIPKEINKFINSDTTKPSSLKRIKSNIFRIQAYDSIMCGYFCIEFINYILKGKTLLDYTNLSSPNDFKKNDQIIKRIFKNK